MALSPELLERFQDWLDAARRAGEVEPTAMCLSTLSTDGGGDEGGAGKEGPVQPVAA